MNKKIIYYVLYFLFAINGGLLMNMHPDFSFFWYIGLFNITCFGGYLVYKLMDFLKRD